MQLHAVTIVVPDYDAGIDFYVGKLGFTLVEDTRLSEEKRWVLVAPPGGDAALLLAKGVGAAQEAAIGNQTGGRVGFFLKVEDFDATFARMTAAGVTFEEAPREEIYGKVAVFRDPFGNRWDLLSFR
ncbi:VOC family protein [Pelagovum pacificum]|uniref:VOC family protein n=1 Tax=Pelagovum pacificum TaxID=2588711 RepID=A0A5C5GET7_9RHOB|nr:VOC family protein [Pelagovum pacificum]QQA44933.1 VOC family protein [Pelagovum pacificum]TNY32469.1 VOC family protein [Pelagovum pacificum]